MREAPRPDYDYDVRRLIRVYERALRDIQAELYSLLLTDFERAQLLAVEANIRAILQDLRKYGNDWVRQTMTKAAREGVAATIYALYLADTFEEALKIARFNSVNRAFVNAIIADTQADLLAVTQNVERRTRSAVRQVVAEVMREKAAAGVNSIQSIQQTITRNLRAKLGSAADSAIVDAAGRRWKLRTYTEMVARTKTMEAHVESSVNEAIDRGVQFAVVSRHVGTCPKCAPWEGRVLALSAANDQGFPTIEQARANGLFHPMCRHQITPVRRLDRLPADIRRLNNID